MNAETRKNSKNSSTRNAVDRDIEILPNERLDDLQYNGLYILQERDGYCFTSDAVILANYVKCKSGGRICDLCSGSGVIGVLAGQKCNAGKVVLVEIQENLADMSKRSIQYNGLENIEVVNKPLQNIHKTIGCGFDVVVCNPPYKKAGSAKLVNEKESIAIARHEIKVTMEEIIQESSLLLKFGGDLYICNKEERLTDILVLLRKYGVEPKEVKIRLSDKGSNIVFVKGRKGGKSGMSISLVE